MDECVLTNVCFAKQSRNLWQFSHLNSGPDFFSLPSAVARPLCATAEHSISLPRANIFSDCQMCLFLLINFWTSHLKEGICHLIASVSWCHWCNDFGMKGDVATSVSKWSISRTSNINRSLLFDEACLNTRPLFVILPPEDGKNNIFLTRSQHRGFTQWCYVTSHILVATAMKAMKCAMNTVHLWMCSHASSSTNDLLLSSLISLALAYCCTHNKSILVSESVSKFLPIFLWAEIQITPTADLQG